MTIVKLLFVKQIWQVCDFDIYYFTTAFAQTNI